MKSSRSIADIIAISLSGLCTIHCLLLPLVLVFLPTAIAITLQDEAFHLGLLALVIPLSLYALVIDCKKHQRYRVIGFGIVGIMFLIGAVIVGHDLGEIAEKTMTVTGAIIISIGHILNYRLCTANNNQCACDE
ncbi:MAG: MerC domain-containing protein [Kangiellaceae bacterium]|jgi:hypothetical protein|nr:MerC domain-containing protein [Kangiellaceae bacterium]